eukprot:CAMPEP_0172744558 /NCGR_PEP_ID=MMETSP1074-20121228/135513_1 /TAXON_ID=2916 /ORGANISM="Ceratium fusus, Strain PA161109" /LENGTH=37 /DNA_ID= /DNA_START= /DNA_END= /DNA_ORIENTATION=
MTSIAPSIDTNACLLFTIICSSASTTILQPEGCSNGS